MGVAPKVQMLGPDEAQSPEAEVPLTRNRVQYKPPLALEEKWWKYVLQRKEVRCGKLIWLVHHPAAPKKWKKE